MGSFLVDRRPLVVIHAAGPDEFWWETLFGGIVTSGTSKTYEAAAQRAGEVLLEDRI